MKILLKGYYGFGNFGDDILMLVSYKLLREKFPSAEIVVFSNFNKNLSTYNREANYNHYIYNILSHRPLLVDWTYQGFFDLVFNGGGGVFFDVQNGGTFNRFLNFLFRKFGIRPIYLIDKYLRILFNKPSNLTFERQIGFGIGIGPYASGAALLGRHMATLGSFNALIVRDQKSLDTLTELKFKKQKYQYTDMAFFQNYWLPIGFALKAKEYSGKLGIILQDLPSEQNIVFASIKKFVNQLRDVKVTFLSFDKNYDQKYVAEFLNDELHVWEPDKMQVDDFLELLQKQDIVISARAHGAIIAALLGAIPICLGISQKLNEISKYFPTGGKLINDPSSINELTDCWKAVVSNYSYLQKALKDDIDQNLQIAQKSKDKLFTML